jgi:uncharacterized protein YwgA
MISFDDAWTEDITDKQQEIIAIHVACDCITRRTAQKIKNASEKTISDFLRSAKGRSALKKYIENIIGETKDTLELKIIKLYMIQAFYNPADIIDDDGLLISPLADLGDLAYCIEGIEKTYSRAGEIVKKVKLVNRDKALEQLARYINIMTDSLQVTGQDGGPLEIWRMTRDERKKKIKEYLKKQKNK